FEQTMPHTGTWQVLLSMERIGNEVQALGWLVLASNQEVTPHLYPVEGIGKISPEDRPRQARRAVGWAESRRDVDWRAGD
ncbi:MAG: hypothetical protein ABIR79_15455, partial [Candidatus Binatia bacterium]